MLSHDNVSIVHIQCTLVHVHVCFMFTDGFNHDNPPLSDITCIICINNSVLSVHLHVHVH